jgi:hypothetical protein
MEAGMRWDDTYKSTEHRYRWHDLMDGDGEDTDGLLGYVREDIIDHIFVSVINDHGGPSKKFDNLEAAKAHIMKRAKDLGMEEMIPENWSDGEKSANEFAAALLEFELLAAEEDLRDILGN